VGSFQNGLKIQKNNMRKTVSEILRMYEIPRRVRFKIPMLFRNQQLCSILFSLWDDKLKDFQGDLYYEAK